MRKSEGQKIPEKEIVKQKFCKNFERGRLLVRRARRCNREDLEQFQFAESAAQILRRDNQRIAFRETQTIYIENPLKSYDFSGFSGPSVIIGSQKTQIYQRFAGSRQEVFILRKQF